MFSLPNDILSQISIDDHAIKALFREPRINAGTKYMKERSYYKRSLCGVQWQLCVRQLGVRQLGNR